MSKEMFIVKLKKNTNGYFDAYDIMTNQHIRHLDLGTEFWLLDEVRNKYIEGTIGFNRQHGYCFIDNAKSKVIYLHNGLEGKVRLESTEKLCP